MVKKILLSSFILVIIPSLCACTLTNDLDSAKAADAGGGDFILNEALFDVCFSASRDVIDRQFNTPEKKNWLDNICKDYKQKVKSL